MTEIKMDQADVGAPALSGKFCPQCSDVVIGHPNKIFCCVECKERYHDRNGPPHIKRALLPDITVEQLHHFMTYWPETGQFIWNVRCGRATKGTIAGTVQSKGYIYINVLRRIYGAHRLAWLWQYGYLPPMPIDHVNGNRTDNRIANLRLATYSENAHYSTTRPVPASSGLRGVHRDGNVWRAKIWKRRKCVSLGGFATKEAAFAAYQTASLKIYGEFSCTLISNEAGSDAVSLNQSLHHTQSKEG